jgi:hypothetical protein
VRNAAHSASRRRRALVGVNSSSERHATSAGRMPSSEQAARFAVTQRRWLSAINIGCVDR